MVKLPQRRELTDKDIKEFYLMLKYGTFGSLIFWIIYVIEQILFSNKIMYLYLVITEILILWSLIQLLLFRYILKKLGVFK